ncbi:MAG: hypothetical protein HY985_07870 [Magnetospirillum sp.]|nr:hypothetical protein [Magnetospirillum sp.]
MVTRPAVLVTIGFAVALAAAMWALVLELDEPASSSSPPPVVAVETQLPSSAPAAFDVVRIGAHGDAMIAGRAPTGGEVSIFDNGSEIGRAAVDARGEWVFVPSLPLVPGIHRFTLDSGALAVVVLPEDEPGAALVVKTIPGEGWRLIQAPPDAAGLGLSIAMVDRGPRGSLGITGRAEPGSLVTVSLDQRLIGRTRTEPDGWWRISGSGAPRHGRHVIGGERFDTRGRTLARSEVLWDATAVLPHDGENLVVTSAGSGGSAGWRIVHRGDGDIADAVVYRSARGEAHPQESR